MNDVRGHALEDTLVRAEALLATWPEPERGDFRGFWTVTLADLLERLSTQIPHDSDASEAARLRSFVEALASNWPNPPEALRADVRHQLERLRSAGALSY